MNWVNLGYITLKYIKNRLAKSRGNKTTFFSVTYRFSVTYFIINNQYLLCSTSANAKLKSHANAKS